MKSSSSGRIRLNTAEPQRQLAEQQLWEHERHGETGLPARLALGLAALFVLSLFFLMPYNPWRLSPAWFVGQVSDHFGAFFRLLVGQREPGMAGRIWQLLVVMLVGAALAATGAIFQGGFRNVLAGPSTMGVMSGGTLGCTLYLLLFVSPETVITYGTADLSAGHSLWELYGQAACTLVGCFASVFLVVGVSLLAGRGRVSAPAMLLSGTVLSSLAGTASQLARYYMILSDPSDTRIEALQDMMMGSLDGVGCASTFVLMAVPIGLCLTVLLVLRGRLDLLGMGEDEVQSMGVDFRFYRLLVIAAGTVLTSVVVAFCGHIGFLGFMAPQIARRLAGPNLRQMLPAAMLTGAILLLVIFDAAYFCGMTGSLNLFTSCIGCIVMAITLLRKGGGRNGTYKAPAAPDLDR